MQSCTDPHRYFDRLSSALSVATFASICCMVLAKALFAQAPVSQTQERERAATFAEATAVRDAAPHQSHPEFPIITS